VGGLLAVTDSSGTYFATFDANGNVSEYLDTTGAISAHYEYDPFGGTTVATGAKATDFPHRFSTKFLDPETGLYYYGYRFYNPEMGRWVNRDPTGEVGSANLQISCANSPTNSVDPLGNHPVWPPNPVMPPADQPATAGECAELSRTIADELDIMNSFIQALGTCRRPVFSANWRRISGITGAGCNQLTNRFRRAVCWHHEITHWRDALRYFHEIDHGISDCDACRLFDNWFLSEITAYRASIRYGHDIYQRYCTPPGSLPPGGPVIPPVNPPEVGVGI
jgi:RHS repeat-associated protein